MTQPSSKSYDFIRYSFLADLDDSFAEAISRIAEEDYIPTPKDILKAKDKRTGIREYKIDYLSLSLKLCDVSGQSRSDSKKWIHSFEHVTCVIFFVDLSCYDQGGETGNRLQESILNFDSMANSRWFMQSSFLLFLNIGAFTEKLRRSPLSNYFPDYEGGNDTKRALDYISRCFGNVHHGFDLNRRLYIRYGEVGDYSAFRIVYQTIKDVNMYNHLITDGLI
jgi:guanine nucleotide-binding protein G(i) subunit alpha